MAQIIGQIGPDFFETEAGKLLVVAKQYMEAALVLVEAPPDRHHVLLRPTLALAGHGLKVMLKACICLNGGVYPKKGRDGHDVGHLWARDECEAVRGHTLINAGYAAEDARYRLGSANVPKPDEVEDLIQEYIGELGRLHGNQGYVLRYTAPDTTLAPRAPFVLQTLWRTADDFIKRPNDYLMQSFRDRILPFL